MDNNKNLTINNLIQNLDRNQSKPVQSEPNQTKPNEQDVKTPTN